MTRLNALLLAVLMACALSLVTSRYQARRLLGAIDTAQGTARKLDVDWSQLQLDQASLSKHSLIDAAARKDLGMQPATPARTEYIILTGKSPPATGTAAAAPRDLQ